MVQYLELLQHVLKDGDRKDDRTHTGTLSIFGHQLRFDLAAGFPLVTTKKIHFHSVVHELLWFLAGDTNVRYLNENGVRIWDEWADAAGGLGPIYGAQWRSWRATDGRQIDQMRDVLNSIRDDPNSRRHIVSSWNVGELPQMRLPPCHVLFQFHVVGGRLSCHLYQRSADVFLGVPFNIASYALLTMMVAHVAELAPGHLVHSFGDAHLYLNHVGQAKIQLARSPRRSPTIQLNPAVRSLFDFRFTDVTLLDYDPHPAIKAPVAV